MDIDVSQINALAVDLDRAGAAAVPKAAAAVKAVAFAVERDSKAFAPVDTGNLKNSISTGVIGLAAEIGPTADYGHYVELGTSRMAPAAYMGPAFDRNAHVLETALLNIAEDL